MSENFILFCLWLAVLAVALGVAIMSARRLVLSRSFNAVAYAQVFAIAATGAAGAGFFLVEDRPIDAGGVVLALVSLPLWLGVRALCHKRSSAYREVTLVPVFTTSRRPLLLEPSARV